MITIRYYQQVNGRLPFQDWLETLPDRRARSDIIRRLDRLKRGHFGTHRFLRDKVWELKIDVGPGYRVYYAKEGEAVILLLCAGSKRTQQKDIERAVEYWKIHLLEL